MRRQLLALIIALIVATVAILAPLAYYSYLSPQPAPPERAAGGPTWQVVPAPDGLEMELSISTNETLPGGSIGINISIVNPTDHNVTVAAAYSWAVGGTSLGPCPSDFPMGISILSGYYTSSNISTAGAPLDLYEPGIISCPISLAIRAFLFLPYGRVDSVALQGSMINGTMFMASYRVSSYLEFSGYWITPTGPITSIYVQGPQPGTVSPAGFQSFEPGTYTVVGATEWGQLALLHFRIIGVSDSNSTFTVTGGQDS
ncbi:MAG: hypothetical protein JRM72_08345 [Nitrososphaerota archaeon]|nr:hypothetical protein [Nitrososphaerota archaeon]MDG7040745.1 hypothetical protein [Nitrososphaerota archaeon]